MHPRAEATALYPQGGQPRCIPAEDPGQSQPVQKTGVVTLQFCGVSKADIQGSSGEAQGPQAAAEASRGPIGA